MLKKKKISPLSTIPSSIYETNSFLFNKNPTLIEYSAFYGSIQIFKYLHNKKAELNTSIWPYAIHGRNADIIHFLEGMKISTLTNSYQYLIIESVKCHHNEIANYFRNNFCEDEKIYNFYLNRKSLKYYNFAIFTDDVVDSLIDSCDSNQELSIPYYLCKYDYFLIVEFIFNSEFKKKLDANKEYKIDKPSNECTDMVRCIAIKNGLADQKSKEDEELEKRSIFGYQQELRRREYTYYEYNTENLPILSIAVRKGNIDIIQLLLKLPRINTNSVSIKNYKEGSDHLYFKVTDKKTILLEAVESGYVDVVQFLLKNTNLDVNCKFIQKKHFQNIMYYEYFYERMLLHQAIKRGNIGIVKLLLSNPNIDVNLESSRKKENSGGCVCCNKSERLMKKSSLYFAIKKGNIKVVQLLLEHPNISFAIKKGNIN